MASLAPMQEIRRIITTLRYAESEFFTTLGDLLNLNDSQRNTDIINLDVAAIVESNNIQSPLLNPYVMQQLQTGYELRNDQKMLRFKTQSLCTADSVFLMTRGYDDDWSAQFVVVLSCGNKIMGISVTEPLHSSHPAIRESLQITREAYYHCYEEDPRRPTRVTKSVAIIFANNTFLRNLVQMTLQTDRTAQNEERSSNELAIFEFFAREVGVNGGEMLLWLARNRYVAFRMTRAMVFNYLVTLLNGNVPRLHFFERYGAYRDFFSWPLEFDDVMGQPPGYLNATQYNAVYLLPMTDSCVFLDVMAESDDEIGLFNTSSISDIRIIINLGRGGRVRIRLLSTRNDFVIVNILNYDSGERLRMPALR